MICSYCRKFLRLELDSERGGGQPRQLLPRLRVERLELLQGDGLVPVEEVLDGLESLHRLPTLHDGRLGLVHTITPKKKNKNKEHAQ